jgi:hypothetical protein
LVATARSLVPGGGYGVVLLRDLDTAVAFAALRRRTPSRVVAAESTRLALPIGRASRYRTPGAYQMVECARPSGSVARNSTERQRTLLPAYGSR